MLVPKSLHWVAATPRPLPAAHGQARHRDVLPRGPFPSSGKVDLLRSPVPLPAPPKIAREDGPSESEGGRREWKEHRRIRGGRGAERWTEEAVGAGRPGALPGGPEIRAGSRSGPGPRAGHRPCRGAHPQVPFPPRMLAPSLPLYLRKKHSALFERNTHLLSGLGSSLVRGRGRVSSSATRAQGYA